MEDSLQPKPSVSAKPRGCGRLFKGCAVTAVLMVVALIATLIYAVRIPSLPALTICQTNMQAVHAALERYNDVNGQYPPDLASLRKDYLKDLAVLRCPLDRSKGSEPSYIYHRPGPDAAGNFVVLECRRHRMHLFVEIRGLQVTKDGSIVYITPMPQEAKKTKPRR